MEASNFTCKNVLPGIGCGFYEFLVLGILFYIVALLAIRYLIQVLKNLSTLFGKMEAVLWITMIIWLFYKGTLFIFPFDYTEVSFRVVYVSIPAILYLIPVTVVVWLICELLFTYNNPGAKIKNFIKILLIGFITVFLIIGICLSARDVSNSVEPGNSISLWYGCTNILTVLFIAFPGYRLLKVINSSSSEYESCINKSIIGLIFFAIIYFLRGLYNILSYVKCNPIQTWVNKGVADVDRYPPTYVRVVSVFYFLIFDGISAVLLLIAAILMLNHSTNLATDPFFARQSPSDYMI